MENIISDNNISWYERAKKYHNKKNRWADIDLEEFMELYLRKQELLLKIGLPTEPINIGEIVDFTKEKPKVVGWRIKEMLIERLYDKYFHETEQSIDIYDLLEQTIDDEPFCIK